MHLSAWLRAKKVSQSEFGEKLKPPVSQGLVSQWVRGATRMTLTYSLQTQKITNNDVSPADCESMFVKASSRSDESDSTAPVVASHAK